jgi:hypothetical protein
MHGIASREAPLTLDEINDLPTAFIERRTTESPDSSPMPGQGIEPQLNVLTIENLPVDADALSVKHEFLLPRIIVETKTISSFLLIPRWHKPYAEALMETDPAKLPTTINLAEQAILARYFDVSPISIEETHDLQNAVDALSDLKQSLRTGDSPEPFVA